MFFFYLFFLFCLLCYFIFFFFFFFLMIRRPPKSTQAHTPFPTRRSSDLYAAHRRLGTRQRHGRPRHPARQSVRSEEHTSELQSRELISYAVFCLKKKK